MSVSISAPSDAAEAVSIEQLPSGWETAVVTYNTKEGPRRSVHIIDLRTNPPMQYTHDSMRTISLKCAGLVLGIPFFACLNIVFHCIRTVALVIGTFGRSTICLIQERSFESLKRLWVDWTHAVPEILCRGIWDIVRLPFLALEMQLCCLYGIFFPLSGRVLAANAERALRGSDRSNALQHLKDSSVGMTDLLTNKDSKYCFYWAFCFQPIAPLILGKNVTAVEYLTGPSTL
jgi:hypothetical protein